MSGRKSRSKGVRGELEACEALKDVWPGLQRTYHQSRSGCDAPDIDGPGCPVWIEVKRCEALNVGKAMEQAVAAQDAYEARPVKDLGEVLTRLYWRPPVIVHKRNRGEWLVTVRASDLARLLGVGPKT